MNKLLFAVGLLSTGLALGQTTGTTSTSTSTSNYNTTNTNNENSRNATMGTNSSTDLPSSTTNNSGRRRGNTSGMRSGTMTQGSSMTPGTSYNSSGSSDNGNNGVSSTGTSTSGTYDNTNNTGSSASGSNNSMGTTTTTGTNSDMNSVGTGTSATTPSTTSDYNSGNTGTSVTTNTTYSSETTARPARTKDYKNFAYGIYAGANTTRFRGESINTDNPAGRIGYQAGFFVRGGGRLYGQIGAEYFASSSNYFRPGDGQSAAAIRDQINVQYVQIPVYIGFKLTESDRGISAIRIQVGAEYANRISSSSGQFNLSNSEIKSGSFNALGQLGFDIGPFLIDLTYHHGLSDAVQINTFQGSSRRILSASVGFKF